MYLRIVTESFTRTPRRKFLTAVALALGMAVATATLTAALDVGDNLEREFRSLGANLIVTPEGRHSAPAGRRRGLSPGGCGRVSARERTPGDEEDFLAQQHRWFCAVSGCARRNSSWARRVPRRPAIPVTLIGTWVRHTLAIDSSETFQTGVVSTNPWWQVEAGGRWFNDQSSSGAIQRVRRGRKFCAARSPSRRRNDSRPCGPANRFAQRHRYRRYRRPRGRRHPRAAQPSRKGLQENRANFAA